jgi:hypothetical protein
VPNGSNNLVIAFLGSSSMSTIRVLARTGEEQIVIRRSEFERAHGAADALDAVQQADIVALLVAHSGSRKSREKLMRRIVIDVTGLTYGYG